MKSSLNETLGPQQCQMLLKESARAIREVMAQSNEAISKVGDDFRELSRQSEALAADRSLLIDAIDRLAIEVRSEVVRLIEIVDQLARHEGVSSARTQFYIEPNVRRIEAELAAIESTARAARAQSDLKTIQNRVVRTLQFNDLTAQTLSEVADNALPAVAQILADPDLPGTPEIPTLTGSRGLKMPTRSRTGSVELF